ncbi:ATP-binding protein [Streptomyces sp. NPDC127077]|uniref:ATP-binding protein n=1 Tax=Streptomyces sp. NPDC127077 TaxID=3347131 RepID=UPI0036522DF3
MAEVPESMNKFSGGQAENVVQAGVVHGGIHLTSEGRSFPPPRQLPLRPNRFVNRRVSLATLDDILAETDKGAQSETVRVSTVSGPPGIGKTALALQWSYGVRDCFPDGDLYVDMQSYGTGAAINAFQALDVFLRALDTPADRIPETLAERSALFRSTLAGKRVLVFIDNAATSAQVRPLLPAASDCFTIVTSRSSLPGLVARDGAARVTLDVLTPQESIDLLTRFVGTPATATELTAAARLAELCGYLPIALRVVGERAFRRGHVSLQELVDELEGEQERLDALQSLEDELSDTRAVFSWSYNTLDEEHRRCFRVLGLHAGAEFSSDAAAALLGTSPADAKKLLLALSSVSLVQEIQANRFRMHDLLRSYAHERSAAEDPIRLRTDAVRRMLTWYLLVTDKCRQTVLPYSAEVPLLPARDLYIPDSFISRTAAWRWFERERLNILSALQQALDIGQLDIAWKLALSASGPLELRSYWAEWESSAKAGLSAAQMLGDELGEAASYLILGDASWRIGRTGDAYAQYEEAADIGARIDVFWIEGFAQRGMGLLCQESENDVAAFQHFEEALRIFRLNGHQRGEGMSLLSVAKLHHMQRDLVKARELVERALQLFSEINDVWTLAWGKLTYASVLIDMKLDDQATGSLQEALDVFTDFGDRRSEAAAAERMGEILYRRGRIDQAKRYWAQAADALAAIGDPRQEDMRQRTGEAWDG